MFCPVSVVPFKSPLKSPLTTKTGLKRLKRTKKRLKRTETGLERLKQD